MPVILTAAQARALGLDVRPSAGVTRRATRRTAPGRLVSRCHDCGALLVGEAAATRHVAPGHARYESVYEQEQLPDA